MQIIVEAGDRIQARKVVETDDDRPEQVIPIEFDTTGVTGQSPTRTVQGCVLGDLLETDGWKFELIRKAVLNLPETLSEIDAVILTSISTITVLTGKGSVWRDTTGAEISAALILAWQPHGN